jgi:glutaredoxin
MSQCVLYTTGCPKCKILEKKLNEKNVKFEIVNDTEKMKELGITSVPVLMVDDKSMIYYDAVKYINSL